MGKTFTEKEYKQIMEMLNRDVQETKQVKYDRYYYLLNDKFYYSRLDC